MRAARVALKIFTVQSVVGLIVVSATASAQEKKANRPKKVSVITVPSPYDAFLVQTGNIRVTFSDGSSQFLTNDGNCLLPRISVRGEIGWVRLDKTSVDLHRQTRQKRRGIDAVVVRFWNGKVKEFIPDEEFPFIGDWKFGDRGKSIVIQSSGHHGPRTYYRFDLQTGAMKDSIETYVPYEQLPLWAKPIAER